MRIYIIGNDGITLWREAPAAVNEGEIVVASNEELHAAELSGIARANRRRLTDIGQLSSPRMRASVRSSGRPSHH
jgi:hypothetical protein